MSKSFDFFFDVVSPYSYLASTQLEALCTRTGATVRFRPFFLGGLMQATGNSPPLTTTVVPKRGWLLQDVRDWADYYGVPFNFPPFAFPFSSLKAERFLTAVVDDEARRLLALKLFDSVWVQGKAIDDPARLVELASSVGLDGAALLAASETEGTKNALKAATEELVKMGAFGAPTFVYAGRFYWGNDRLVLLEAALRRP